MLKMAVEIVRDRGLVYYVVFVYNLFACLCHCSLICFVSLVFLVDCHSRCICGSAAEIAVAPAFGWALPGQLPTICSVPAPSSRNGLCREQRLLQFIDFASFFLLRGGSVAETTDTEAPCEQPSLVQCKWPCNERSARGPAALGCTTQGEQRDHMVQPAKPYRLKVQALGFRRLEAQLVPSRTHL